MWWAILIVIIAYIIYKTFSNESDEEFNEIDWYNKHRFDKDFWDEEDEVLSSYEGEEDEEEIEEDRRIYLKNRFKDSSVEEIVFNNEIEEDEKKFLLKELYHYSNDEIDDIFETARREAKKAKLKPIKRKISKKADELYGNIPSDDNRKPIPDDVKMYVWQRDKGRCVRCGSKENLEFDHIIPLSKGGSNTKRNIQLLCEKCNRSKRDSIT